MPQRQKRKTTGCVTCRSGKVSCDESRPACNRCVRLQKPCGYSQGPRPVGSVRFRSPSWVPAPILPASSIPAIAGVPAAVAMVPAVVQSEDQFTSTEPSYVDSDPFMTQTNANDEDIEQMHWSIPISDDFQSNLSLDFDSYTEFMCFDEPILDFSTTSVEIMTEIFDKFTNHSLSIYHVSLPNSLELDLDEHRALKHYQTTYSLYRTTKDPEWSTHMVLLRIGSTDRMIMHLLLAVSINDLQHRSGGSLWSEQAHNHFQRGVGLLIDFMQGDSESKHISLMASFFLTYLYMTKRRFIAPQELRQLSLAVTNYVKKYDLDSLCIGPLQSPNIPEILVKSCNYNRSLLARLIMWTFDEDIKCSFLGNGGHFARHLTDHGMRTKDVYDVSRNALSVYFGAEYPVSQNMDDQQNSTVLEFLWALLPLWQDINEISQHNDHSLPGRCARIEQAFVLLEEKYLSVFQISADKTSPRTRLFVNADYDVVLFNALRVYFFRSTISDLSMETPPEYKKCLMNLLTIISRTFTSRNSELYDRLQWPLFIAGIETNDEVYQNWISMLSSGRAGAALARVLHAQKVSGKRLTMHEIRGLLYDAEELALPIPASSVPFLEVILSQIAQPKGYRYQVI